MVGPSVLTTCFWLPCCRLAHEVVQNELPVPVDINAAGPPQVDVPHIGKLAHEVVQGKSPEKVKEHLQQAPWLMRKPMPTKRTGQSHQLAQKKKKSVLNSDMGGAVRFVVVGTINIEKRPPWGQLGLEQLPSNLKFDLPSNHKNANHSDVVGASPFGAAATTSSFLT